MPDLLALDLPRDGDGGRNPAHARSPIGDDEQFVQREHRLEAVLTAV
jgi:hypothetical protein